MSGFLQNASELVKPLDCSTLFIRFKGNPPLAVGGDDLTKEAVLLTAGLIGTGLICDDC